MRCAMEEHLYIVTYDIEDQKRRHEEAPLEYPIFLEFYEFYEKNFTFLKKIDTLCPHS
jgi:hypothetical protein